MTRVLFALLLFTLPLAAQDTYDLASADEAMLAGDYPRAVRVLDSLERDGRVSPEFYLALGNARFELGRPGPAILAYERGLRLRPGNKDLRNNLRFVREEAGITTPELPDFFLLRWWRLLGALLGTPVAYGISMLFWWLAVAGFVWWFLRRGQMEEKRRFALLPGALACALLCGAFYALGSTRHTYLTADNEAVLISDATLRVAPTEEGSVEADLPQGYKLRITDRVNRFVKVSLPDGRQGYVTVGELEVI